MSYTRRLLLEMVAKGLVSAEDADRLLEDHGNVLPEFGEDEDEENQEQSEENKKKHKLKD